MSQECANSFDPPPITRRTECVPVVHRIAPSLPIGTEVVGGNSSDETRATPLIEQEKLGIRPNIARIRRHKERKVANQPHSLGVGVFLDLIGLSQQQKFSESNAINFTRQLSARFS